MQYRIIIGLLLLMVSGCATQRIPFPEEELSGLTLAGNKTVKGKVFLVDQMEEKQLAVGSEVTLEPLTSYSEQWYQVSYLQNKSIRKPDPRYAKYIMRTTTAEDGSFSLEGVAAGSYLLSSTLLWEAITCSANLATTKVMISKKITVKADDVVLEVPLTKDFESPMVVCDLYTQGAWEKENPF